MEYEDDNPREREEDIFIEDNVEKFKNLLLIKNKQVNENYLLVSSRLGAIKIMKYIHEEKNIPFPSHIINVSLSNGNVATFFYLLDRNQRQFLDINYVFKYSRDKQIANFKDFFILENKNLFQQYFNCNLDKYPRNKYSDYLIVILTLSECLNQKINGDSAVPKIVDYSINTENYEDLYFFLDKVKVESIKDNLAKEIMAYGFDTFHKNIINLNKMFTQPLTGKLINEFIQEHILTGKSKDWIYMSDKVREKIILHNKEIVYRETQKMIIKYVQKYGLTNEEILKIKFDIGWLLPYIEYNYKTWLYLLKMDTNTYNTNMTKKLMEDSNMVKIFCSFENKNDFINILLAYIRKINTDGLNIIFKKCKNTIKLYAPIKCQSLYQEIRHEHRYDTEIDFYESYMEIVTSIEEELPELFSYLDMYVEHPNGEHNVNEEQIDQDEDSDEEYEDEDEEYEDDE